MIVAHLCGGLGNQFFQYATARRLAYFHNTELVLDINWYTSPPQCDTPRIFELSCYFVQARIPTAFEAKFFQLYGGRFLRRLPLPRLLYRYREKGFGFDPKILDLPDNSYLDGYWQSPKYFEDIADILRIELTPRIKPGDDDLPIANAIKNSNAISVHVRRGDYVTSPTAAAMHGTCPLEYYNQANRRIMSLISEPHFFVFSDDPDWTASNLSFPGQVTYVAHNSQESAFQDLRLMSMCQHHIIANSSFSWWGAWLNTNPHKIVIAPKGWFANGQNTDDLIPTGWLRL